MMASIVAFSIKNEKKMQFWRSPWFVKAHLKSQPTEALELLPRSRGIVLAMAQYALYGKYKPHGMSVSRDKVETVDSVILYMLCSRCKENSPSFFNMIYSNISEQLSQI